MARKFLYSCTGLLFLVLMFQLGARTAAGQGAGALVSMADYPRQQHSAVAVDQSGGIYFGHLQQWTRVGTAPGRPVAIWSRASDGGVLLALENGDVYQLGSPASPVGDLSLTYDSNVFAAPTPGSGQSWGALKVKAR